MTNGITLNHKNGTIEMTKKFETAASRFGSREYNDLQTVRRDYPTYQIDVKTSTRKHDGYRGLTIAFMKDYIEKKVTTRADEIKKANDPEAKNEFAEIQKDFYSLCGMDEDGKKLELASVASYKDTKDWFLQQFPEFEAQRERIKEILGKKAA